eukprot:1781697-Pyramimonas_sp.AAC.1
MPSCAFVAGPGFRLGLGQGRGAAENRREFINWWRDFLEHRSRPAHLWTKPKGWMLSQVRASLGPSSHASDVAGAQRDCWADIWDGADELACI